MRDNERRTVYTRPATVIGRKPAPRDPRQEPETRARGTEQSKPLARGTREDLRPNPNGCLVEHQLGMEWWYSLRMEQLGRNLAFAGGLEYAYRLGRAHADFEAKRWGHRR